VHSNYVLKSEIVIDFALEITVFQSYICLTYCIITMPAYHRHSCMLPVHHEFDKFRVFPPILVNQSNSRYDRLYHIKKTVITSFRNGWRILTEMRRRWIIYLRL